MKRVSLMIAALALVLGLSQCKKQEEPVANGQKQHIVLTADNGNDGSKVSADFVSANLNLTWDGDEVITVSGGATGTLDKITVDKSNPSKATFEGDIEITDESEPFVFTVGKTPNYENQLGTEKGCEAWIHDNISLKGTDYYDPEGQYSADMKLPYAVLKLDVSALGTSGKLEIKAGGTFAASVANVSNPTEVFVAVPTDGSEMEYKISIGDKTATKTWTLLPNTFYTKSNGTGGGTGDAFVIEPDAPAVEYPGLCFTAVEAGSSVSMGIYGSLPDLAEALETSTDGKTWKDFTPGATTITLANIGDKVYFRKKGTEAGTSFSTGSFNYAYFVMTGKIAASGNVMSLLDPKCEVTEFDADEGACCFCYLFYGCTSLITAPELPATNLAGSCYEGMFKNCTSLTTAPALPATILAEYCYDGMFSGCTSLTTAHELPATDLAEGCYWGMFYGCTSLTTAPALPATTLTFYCYHQMFGECIKLNSITVHFTEWGNNTTAGWVEGVSATGTFHCPSNLPEKYGQGNIPTGWTVVTF